MELGGSRGGQESEGQVQAPGGLKLKPTTEFPCLFPSNMGSRAPQHTPSHCEADCFLRLWAQSFPQSQPSTLARVQGSQPLSDPAPPSLALNPVWWRECDPEMPGASTAITSNPGTQDNLSPQPPGALEHG